MRVAILGVYQPKTRASRGYRNGIGAVPYFYALGYERLDGLVRAHSTFSPSEEHSFRTLGASRNVYELLASQVAPGIGGRHVLDIKKILLCQLFGGISKVSLGYTTVKTSYLLSRSNEDAGPVLSL